jgi:tetratricopeptide (TPR) repeat protein
MASKHSTTINHSKGDSARRRDNILKVQNVLLIWLDNTIDVGNDEYQNTLAQLRRIINAVNTFTNRDPCVDFLTDIDTATVFMIISGELGQEIIPLIHDIIQLDSIFIFCGNQKQHEQWINDWPKIKGVFTEISSVCETVKKAAQQCEHNAIGMSFMPTSGEASNTPSDQLDCSFMYTQIMKEILLTIKFEQEHIQEFTAYCREVFSDNDSQLIPIRKMERKYREETPIWWYTFGYFLYPMLNHALRTMDVNIIIMMGFFITDLHRHIERLHIDQFGAHPQSQVLTVYRGQGLSKTDFDQLVKTKGGLMSFNNFLSTSKDRDVSFVFAESNQINNDLVGILFVMSIDPSLTSTPFAAITDVSYFKTEDEVLFSMHTIFRIREVKSMGENNRLWQVDLTVTNDNDQDLHTLTERIREETFPNSTGWDRLGQLLLKMGQSDKAQQVYKVMLRQASDEGGKAAIYHQLGWVKYNQGQYKEAITFSEQSLEIYQKTLPPTHPHLTASYNNIGLVYDNMGKYSKALSYYEKALKIQQKTLPPTHPDLAASYNNIGLVYDNMGEYSKALSYDEKVLQIRQKTLPPTHPHLAASYNNIGVVYYNKDEYSKALSYYEKALKIRQITLPPTHPDLAASYHNIGVVYKNKGEYSKALSYYEKALQIRQITLPPTHPDLAASHNNIGVVYYNKDEYSKALSYYEKALEIRQITLPPTHPDLAASYHNIGVVYKNKGEYSKALSYYEKALEIRQKTLPPTHPDLASSYNNIGAVYSNMGEYSKALSYDEKALEIRQKTLPPTHPDLAKSYYNIGLVYDNMDEHSKALSYYETALEIRQKTLPLTHPDLAASYNNIGSLYDIMGDYSKALSYYEKALEIRQITLSPTHPDLVP